MRPIFQAELVNPVFGDPGLYVDLKFERRALLFDIGDIDRLSTRKLLRVGDVFVSHTHMDHFAGFDHLLRVCLGRDTGVNLYGPPNFIDQVEHKLLAYTWNLVENYATDFTIVAHELRGELLHRARFSSRHRFKRERLEPRTSTAGELLVENNFVVRCKALDHHGLPSLAFRFEEGIHINVWKNRLEQLQLPTGPWLTHLKALVRAGAPDGTLVPVRWRDREGHRERTFALGELKNNLLQFVPGQCLAYVTDVAGHEQNQSVLLGFLADVDVLFIEAVFLDADMQHAAQKAHLTAQQAGAIARLARVKIATPFHFSPRYMGREQELRSEFMNAWNGATTLGTQSDAASVKPTH